MATDSEIMKGQSDNLPKIDTLSMFSFLGDNLNFMGAEIRGIKAARSRSTWWVRERVSEYFPAFSKDSPALIDFLKARNLLPTLSRQAVSPFWKQALDSIRYVTNHLEATLLFWSVLTAGLALICTSGSGKK